MRRIMVAVALLGLTGCGNGDAGSSDGSESAGSSDGSAGSVAAAVAGGAASLQPGLWETTVQVVRMNIPNMPQGISMPTPPTTTVRNCLTPEQAQRPNADFMSGSGESGGCTYSNFSMENGRIQGAFQCDAEGGSMRSTMEGQYTPTSYEMTMQTQTTAQGMSMDLEARTTARRVGDCPSS